MHYRRPNFFRDKCVFIHNDSYMQCKIEFQQSLYPLASAYALYLLEPRKGRNRSALQFMAGIERHHFEKNCGILLQSK